MIIINIIILAKWELAANTVMWSEHVVGGSNRTALITAMNLIKRLNYYALARSILLTEHYSGTIKFGLFSDLFTARGE